MKRKAFFTIVLSVFAVIVLSCYPGCNGGYDIDGNPQINQSPEVGPNVGQQAPDFALMDLEGNYASLSDYNGSPVMLNFWATWCGPCRSEMPYIQQVLDVWEERGLVILTINLRESSSKVAQFMLDNNYSMPVLLDSNGAVSNDYKVSAIPTTLFIDADGLIKERHIGSFSDKEEIESQLDDILP